MLSTARFRVIVVVVAVLAPTLAGCGFIPEQGSCDHRPDRQACEDLLSNRNNHLRPTFVSLCELGGGTWSDGLCDRGDALGGCLCEGCENGRSVTWYFAGATTTDGDGDAEAAPQAGDAGVSDGEVPAVLNTASDVQAVCDAQNRTFVDPSVADP